MLINSSKRKHFTSLSHYKSLIESINAHNKAYYINNSPTISDTEYDVLFAKLKDIEFSHPERVILESPTQQLVGQYEKIEQFEQVAHPYPLLSLQNTYNADDLLEWYIRSETILVKETDYTVDDIGEIGHKTQKNDTDGEVRQSLFFGVEPKFDGISIELVYRDRKLIQAVTRGNGSMGDDVTHNVRTIQNLPHVLKESAPAGELRLRGEIMMPKSTWTSLNTQREKDGLAVFANTRNAASGSMKMLDSQTVSERGLVCFVFDILSSYETDTPHEVLKTWGLPVFDRYKTYSDMQDVTSLCHDNSVREYFLSQDIDFDGLVVKLLGERYRQALGSTDHHPRRAVAYKFPAAQAAAQIMEIEYSVGRTGIISPVAIISPVSLSGVTIGRVSLHNFDIIASKDVRLGDWVWVQRSGEVIPYIIGVILERRDGIEKSIVAPSNCPICEQHISMIEDRPYCTNIVCPAQMRGRLEHRCSKNCLDIDGIGESVIDMLVTQGFVKIIPDLYRLNTPETVARLHKLDGFGEKKILKMFDGMTKSLTAPLWRKLNGLGLPQIGKKMAKSLADDFARYTGEGDIIYYLSDTERLESIFGMGKKVSLTVSEWMHTETNIALINDLLGLGLIFDSSLKSVGEETLFTGTLFSLTGSFPLGRDEVIAHCEGLGMSFVATPSKKTDYMLIGEKPGSKKEKADSLGVQLVIGWEDVSEMFGIEEVKKDDGGLF